MRTHRPRAFTFRTLSRTGPRAKREGKCQNEMGEQSRRPDQDCRGPSWLGLDRHNDKIWMSRAANNLVLGRRNEPFRLE